MATEIRVPTLGESVTEATIGKWFKKAGDAVAADEALVELETDKVTIEVPAPASGTLAEITAKDGETVGVGALLGMIAKRAAPRRRSRRRPSRKADPRQPPASGAATVKKAAEKTAAIAGEAAGRGTQDAGGARRGEAARREQPLGRPGRGLGQARPGAQGRRARRHRQGRAIAAGRNAEGAACAAFGISGRRRVARGAGQDDKACARPSRAA